MLRSTHSRILSSFLLFAGVSFGTLRGTIIKFFLIVHKTDDVISVNFNLDYLRLYLAYTIGLSRKVSQKCRLEARRVRAGVGLGTGG